MCEDSCPNHFQRRDGRKIWCTRILPTASNHSYLACISFQDWWVSLPKTESKVGIGSLRCALSFLPGAHTFVKKKTTQDSATRDNNRVYWRDAHPLGLYVVQGQEQERHTAMLARYAAASSLHPSLQERLCHNSFAASLLQARSSDPSIHNHPWTPHLHKGSSIVETRRKCHRDVRRKEGRKQACK